MKLIEEQIFLGTLGINRNMRCIEIENCQSWAVCALSINRNMRCIEIDILKSADSDIFD